MRLYWSSAVVAVNGLSCDTQVGHLIPLRYDGPDVIENILPMNSNANWAWDQGLTGLSNSGRILVASNAPSANRRAYEAGRMIRFPGTTSWPRPEYLEWHRDMIFEKGPQPGLSCLPWLNDRSRWP